MTGTCETRDEAQMIASILAGETQLYHELIRPYERSVYRMALSYMKNEADAEDVVQEAFLKAFSPSRDVPLGGKVQYVARGYCPE
jgi:RNA polymerase sigma-70 factor, ECF subfamily